MKVVILTIFVYITTFALGIKLKNQYREFNFNFGKFAQRLNSESKILLSYLYARP